MIRKLFGTQIPLLVVAAFFLCFESSVSFGQARSQRKLPVREDTTRTTKDGVQLRCRFFPGTREKQSAPIILIHAWQGSSDDLLPLAAHLQKEHGHAVVVPDLRGHGASTTRRVPGRAEVQDLKLVRLKPSDIRNMFVRDLEEVKNLLLEQHNAGKLNIELLSVIGVEVGALLAANWAAQDWSWPVLPSYKQGQDVKAVVLISAPAVFKGLRLQTAFTRSPRPVREKVSTLIVYNRRDTKSAKASTQLHKILQKYHAQVPDDRQERVEKQDLFLVGHTGQARGADLVRDPKIVASIVQFLDWRIVQKASRYPWVERINPLGN